MVPGRSTRSLAFTVDVRGTLTEGDVMAAQWLHIKPRPIFAVIGVSLLAVTAWALWYALSRPKVLGAAWLMVGGILLIAAGAMLLRYKALRNYRQRKAMQRDIRFATTDTGLAGVSETGLGGTVPWTDFLKWKEDRGLFLLYVSDDSFLILPKRYFRSAVDISAFREILSVMVKAK